MLGNETDAAFIRDWFVAEVQKSFSEQATEPEGWKRLGAGVSRVAFLSPEGVVYKVQRYYGEQWGQSNEREDQNIKEHRLRKLPEGCRLPRWHFYRLDGRGVMAMEAFAKLLNDVEEYTEERMRMDIIVFRLQKALRSFDLHSHNVAVEEDTGILVPIDLGI